MSRHQIHRDLSQNEILARSPLPLIGLCGGIGASTAEVMTFGFDNVKTRMQMNGKQGLPHYSSLTDCIKQTYDTSGITGFYRGLSAAVFRQITYSTVRIYIYEQIKRNHMTKEQENDFFYKFISGGIAGAIGCVVGTPGDILKIRLINDFTKSKYKGFFDCFKKILRNEGWIAFSKGLNVNITRAILVNAAELSAYDQSKSLFTKQFGFNDQSLSLHFLSSTMAGLFGAICSSPADVVKTRYMNQAKGAKNSYKSAIDCTLKIAQNEGLGAFYRGFLSYFLRIAPWNIVMFMSYEQYKKQILSKWVNH